MASPLERLIPRLQSNPGAETFAAADHELSGACAQRRRDADRFSGATSEGVSETLRQSQHAADRPGVRSSPRRRLELAARGGRAEATAEPLGDSPPIRLGGGPLLAERHSAHHWHRVRIGACARLGRSHRARQPPCDVRSHRRRADLLVVGGSAHGPSRSPTTQRAALSVVWPDASAMRESAGNTAPSSTRMFSRPSVRVPVAAAALTTSAASAGSRKISPPRRIISASRHLDESLEVQGSHGTPCPTSSQRADQDHRPSRNPMTAHRLAAIAMAISAGRGRRGAGRLRVLDAPR